MQIIISGLMGGGGGSEWLPAPIPLAGLRGGRGVSPFLCDPPLSLVFFGRPQKLHGCRVEGIAVCMTLFLLPLLVFFI